MGKCIGCGSSSPNISELIGLCANCLRKGLKPTRDPHSDSRSRFNLPTDMYRYGKKCCVCGRECLIGDQSMGYCGYRRVLRNEIQTSTGTPLNAVGMYYYDPHPTNCVAFPVCPAVTGLGYPEYALSPQGEYGYYNIAVFYGGCNLDCIYCQNWEHREMASRGRPVLSIDSLVRAVNDRTTCVCFFGGDPSPFAPHAILASKKMIQKASTIGMRVFRVCWETNGLWNPDLLREATRLSLATGGIVKIDFKAWSPEIYRVLCGIEEKHVSLIKSNIKLVSEYMKSREKPPILIISTLLVPGYVDDYEIEQMTKYVASLNPKIPYVFLAFHPDYMLVDLPTTSRRHAEKAVKIAYENGLVNVYIGNVFLLKDTY